MSSTDSESQRATGSARSLTLQDSRRFLQAEFVSFDRSSFLFTRRIFCLTRRLAPFNVMAGPMGIVPLLTAIHLRR